MDKIGMRLREERIRLEYSQKGFAAIGGVLSNAQSKYEHEERSPSAVYLARLATVGVDVSYVLTGRYSHVSDESELGSAFRQLPSHERRVVMELVKCFAKRA